MFTFFLLALVFFIAVSTYLIFSFFSFLMLDKSTLSGTEIFGLVQNAPLGINTIYLIIILICLIPIFINAGKRTKSNTILACVAFIALICATSNALYEIKIYNQYVLTSKQIKEIASTQPICIQKELEKHLSLMAQDKAYPVVASLFDDFQIKCKLDEIKFSSFSESIKKDNAKQLEGLSQDRQEH